ncbi:enoyl-CoA hydratase/isomerase family protein [Streptomyces sp. NPDC017940]|uniref:enoyl-CoA hydratase/isomerase family protein n=1 Tax=Streptomyces sp. NPDC017940 TaxID=3365017 RepID=UPI00379009ED
MSPDVPPVRTRVEGRAGHIVLNRPRALNALDHPMVRLVDEALTAWEHDDTVRTVVMSGAGERGLCAGGDIRAVREDILAGGGAASAAYWRDEYLLDARIARYPKPYVALMDGFVMGGGVGVSAHGDVRVVTERSRVAMPETIIGFVLDVGATFLLTRAPGELGTHMALTGTTVSAADAVLCGLADHYVPSGRLAEFTAALADADPAEAVRQYAEAVPASELAVRREWIDSCYAADSVEEIVDRLQSCGEPAAKEAADDLLSRSPTALKVTLAALRRARRLPTLEQALDQEYRVSCACLTAPDFPEGVRAQVVDKDRTPRWSPADLASVTEADVERFFEPGAYGELGLGSGELDRGSE